MTVPPNKNLANQNSNSISRDVVLDLLPLYLAGEASEDSKQLVDGYIHANPEFATWLKENQASLIPAPPLSPSAQLEKETFMKFKNEQRRKSFLLALAIFFTAMPFAFIFEGDKGLVWWMIKDSPSQAYGFLFIAVCTWIGYIWSSRDKTES